MISTKSVDWRAIRRVGRARFACDDPASDNVITPHWLRRELTATWTNASRSNPEPPNFAAQECLPHKNDTRSTPSSTPRYSPSIFTWQSPLQPLRAADQVPGPGTGNSIRGGTCSDWTLWIKPMLGVLQNDEFHGEAAEDKGFVLPDDTSLLGVSRSGPLANLAATINDQRMTGF